MMNHCLIIHDQTEQSQLLSSWLKGKGFQVHVLTERNKICQSAKLYTYKWVWIHVKQWDFQLLNYFPKEQRYVLLSKFRERFTDSLDLQVPFHLKEPFEERKLELLFDRLQHASLHLQSDCLFAKSNWQYKRIYLRDIIYVKGSKAYYFSWVKTKDQLITITGALKFWEKQLCKNQLFRRVKNNLLLPDRVQENAVLDITTSTHYLSKNPLHISE